jgi:hypothetical protein
MTLTEANYSFLTKLAILVQKYNAFGKSHNRIYISIQSHILYMCTTFQLQYPRILLAIFPQIKILTILIPKTWFDESQFISKFILTIITIPSTFLTITCNSMSFNFMCNPSITHNFKCYANMLNN